MTQFKTVALPAADLKGVKQKDLFSLQTANLALAPIAKAIEAEAKGGWKLHSYVVMPATIWRKKTIGDFLHVLLGWIPLIGDLLFKKPGPDYVTQDYCSLIFEKEV